MRDPATDHGLRLDQHQVSATAGRIIDAERRCVAIPPLTDTFPEMGLADAYAIQQAYARCRMDAGAKVLGHKVGATSQAIQALFGIDTPDFGHLFDDMLIAEDEPIPVATLIQPMTEPEIAFVLDEELRGPGLTAQDVMAATAGVVPCLEIIDSRIRNWQIKLADTVADNGSSARFVLGAPMVPISDLTDLAAEEVELRCNGEVVQTGRGDAVLGHPADSVAWLANALAAFGGSLPRSAYVLSGSLTTAVPSRMGDRYEAVFSSIGTVSCSFR